MTIRGETYYVHADENYKAKLKGVKLYMLDYPKKVTFAYLMSVAQAHLVHPETSGRKPLMDFRLL